MFYLDFENGSSLNLSPYYPNLITADSSSNQFVNEYSQMDINSGFSTRDFTIFIDSKRISTEDQILFSSYNASNPIRSGFSVGINEINQPYFQYYNNLGPQIITSDKFLTYRSLISISVSNNDLIFGLFNSNTLEFETENFNLVGNYEIRNLSNQWTIGATNYFVPETSPKYFSGEINKILYVKSPLSTETMNLAVQGFYKSGSIFNPLVEMITDNEITGYEYTTGLIPRERYETYFAGNIYDNCVNEFPIYRNYIGTGFLTGRFFVPLSHDVSYTITGYEEITGLIDENQLKKYQYTSVGIVRPRETGDSLFGFYSNDERKDIWNKRAIYDNAQGEFVFDSLFNTGNPFGFVGNEFQSEQIFVNGQYVFRSGIQPTGTVLNPFYVLDWDYSHSGRIIFSNQIYQQSDILVYDINDVEVIVSYQFQDEFPDWGYFHPITSEYPYHSGSFYGYLNGQALIQGEDFNANYIAGTTYHIGEDFLVYLADDRRYASGHGFKVIDYFPRTSRLWMNGQRQTLNLDYMEMNYQNAPLLTGLASFSKLTSILNISDFSGFLE